MNDQLFMQVALDEARLAAAEDEIPLGAGLVKNGEIVLRDHNRSLQLDNPMAHAEKLILDKAQEMGLKYLQDYTFVYYIGAVSDV
jgi:tRNA(adenine34) deaminase